jgi:peptide methionine sulfoxide reductase msrA/msrB
MLYNPLSPEEKAIIVDKQTEPPFQNEYDDFFVDGTYICKQCNQPLFSSKAKFDAGCGWPSFDEEIPLAIKRQKDADGERTEILCANCGGHLGHVFEGEKFTDKNTRHCVNSISMKFIPQNAASNNETAYFGGGCFWCTEAIFKRLGGVTKVTPGYSGGHLHNPSYEQVSNSTTGHAEVIKIEYDNTLLSFDQLLKVFFETHDPSTPNQQGADIGEQYRSIILYTTLDQKRLAEEYILKLQVPGEKFVNVPIVTKIQPFIRFYQAEDYHLSYFENNKNQPYCQLVIQPKIDKLTALDIPKK